MQVAPCKSPAVRSKRRASALGGGRAAGGDRDRVRLRTRASARGQRQKVVDLAGRRGTSAAAARWRSGYAEDCKSLHAGSIPARASTASGAETTGHIQNFHTRIRGLESRLLPCKRASE